MSVLAKTIEAELTWIDGRFERDVRVTLTPDGRIGDVGPARGGADLRLTRRALLPGFVSAHSHAFQRALRGLGESFPAGAGSFWTWREAMYELVLSLDEQRVHDICLGTFREMLACGITCVGEFHYIRHGERPLDHALDAVVLTAAKEAGIRLCLMPSFYQRGGFDKPLSEAQRRFESRSVEEYWDQFDRLRARLDPALQSLGASAHSVRAVSPNDLEALGREAHRRELPFHIHLEEQRKEVRECQEAHGATPMQLLMERVEINERVTAVHCTHTDPLEMEAYLAKGGRVCLCPLTEANLGDGIPDVATLIDSDGAICIGTDSNARISALEEIRWLEYVQRLDGERRGAVVGGGGDVAGPLLRIGAEVGGEALGIETGAIRVGLWGDFAAVDLDATALEGVSAGALAAGLVCGGGNEVVCGACVGGRWLVGP